MAWISSNVAGPAMRVLITPCGGVARATPRIRAPTAQTTRVPPTIRLNVFRVMIGPPTVCVGTGSSSLGAQTERRGDAGPVSPRLGGRALPRTPTGHQVSVYGSEN